MFTFPIARSQRHSINNHCAPFVVNLRVRQIIFKYFNLKQDDGVFNDGLDEYISSTLPPLILPVRRQSSHTKNEKKRTLPFCIESGQNHLTRIYTQHVCRMFPTYHERYFKTVKTVLYKIRYYAAI